MVQNLDHQTWRLDSLDEYGKGAYSGITVGPARPEGVPCPIQMRTT